VDKHFDNLAVGVLLRAQRRVAVNIIVVATLLLDGARPLVSIPWFMLFATTLRLNSSFDET
jgi:hypothetical protein